MFSRTWLFVWWVWEDCFGRLQVPLPNFMPAGAAAEDLSGQASRKPWLHRKNLAKSGVPNVTWDKKHRSWQVVFPSYDGKGKRNGLTSQKFSLASFVEGGLIEEEADLAALEAAETFRAELVKQGILKEPKPMLKPKESKSKELKPKELKPKELKPKEVKPKEVKRKEMKPMHPNTNEVPGVSWDQKPQKRPLQQRIWFGFTEKAVEVLEPIEHLERQDVVSSEELPIFTPKVRYPGVKWNRHEQQWHARCTVNNATQHFLVKPKDHSEAELEASFEKAVAWRKKQEETWRTSQRMRFHAAPRFAQSSGKKVKGGLQPFSNPLGECPMTWKSWASLHRPFFFLVLHDQNGIVLDWVVFRSFCFWWTRFHAYWCEYLRIETVVGK